MRRNFLTFICTLLIACSIGNINAQKPYNHSVGGIGGNMFGLSYKTYLLDNLALGMDFGVKLVYTNGEGIAGSDIMTLELNPNVMYAKKFKPNLDWVFGGGVSLGYNFLADQFQSITAGKFGINALAGLEYKFNIPLVLQGDIRPGYGMSFQGGHDVWHYFDWALCVSVRYVFDVVSK